VTNDQTHRAPWSFFVLGAIVGAVSVVFLLAPGIWLGVAAVVGTILIVVLDRVRRQVDERPRSAIRRSTAVWVWVVAIVAVAGIAAVAWLLVTNERADGAAWVAGLAISGVVAGAGLINDRAPVATTPSFTDRL